MSNHEQRSNFEAVYRLAVKQGQPLADIPYSDLQRWGYRQTSTIDQHGNPYITLQPLHRENTSSASLQFESFVLPASEKTPRTLYHLSPTDDLDRIKYESAREATIEQMSARQLEEQASHSPRQREMPRKGFTINILADNNPGNIKIGSVTIELIKHDGKTLWHISSTEITAAKASHDTTTIFKKALAKIRKSAQKSDIDAITCLVDTQKQVHREQVRILLEKVWMTQNGAEAYLNLSSMTPGRHVGEPTPCQVIWQRE